MKRDEPDAILTAETGATLSGRLPINTYAPVDAPLAMPAQSLESVFDVWLRRLSAHADAIVKGKRNRNAGAGAG